MIGWKPTPFIFVHIPKCAGTSVEEAFIPILTERRAFVELSEMERSRFWLPGRKGLQHSKLKRYGQHFNLKNFLKFSFVRNPWDRAVSQIGYLNSLGAEIFAGKDFKEQLRAYCAETRFLWGHHLGACQVDYLLDGSGRMRMDFIGRFESLEADFQTVCLNLGLDPIPKLPHVFNSGRSAHYSTYYDEESAEWISRRYARDIDRFGYKFERP